jgi:putative transposase
MICASPYEVAHIGHKGVRLASINGGDSRFLDFNVIQQLMDNDQLETTYTPPLRSNASRAGLSDHQIDALNRKLRYVRAVTKQTDKVGSRKQLAPIIRDLAREIEDNSPPGVSTVAGWVKRWIEGGRCESALMPAPKPSRARFEESDDLQKILMKAVKKVYMNSQKNPISAVQTEVAVLVAEYNCQAETPLRVPSTETIRRFIRRIDAYQLDVARHGKAYAKRRHRATGRCLYTTDPLEIVMADGQVMDIIVVEEDDEGNPGTDIGRPFLTVVFDVHTRCVLAAEVTLAPFCGATLLKAMNRACVAQPGKPRGIPDTLIVDNGADYQDSGFINAMRRLGTLLEVCPPYTPNGKAHVERFFRTLNEQLVHKLSGTTFSNPKEKGDYHSQEMARITLKELQSHVETWIETIYHTNLHRSLGRAPIDVWNEEVVKAPVNTLSAEDADILFRTTVSRVVTGGCVQVHDLKWHSHALRTWELKQRNLRRKPEVEVQIDELDLGHVYVRIGGDAETIIQAGSTQPQYTRHLSLYEHRLLKQEIRNKGIRERFERMQDTELYRLRLEYYAALGHADDKVARVRRDRLRDALTARALPEEPRPEAERKPPVAHSDVTREALPGSAQKAPPAPTPESDKPVHIPAKEKPEEPAEAPAPEAQPKTRKGPRFSATTGIKRTPR